MQSEDIKPAVPPFNRRHKGAILLATLLLLILLAPLGELFKDSKLLDMILATVVMAASLHAISYRQRRTVFLAVALATMAVISGWMQVGFDSSVHQILSHSFGAALYLYIAALLFKVILIEDEITVDQLFTAVAIYITTGIGGAGDTYGRGLICDVKGIKIDVVFELMIANEFDFRSISDKKITADTLVGITDVFRHYWKQDV